MITTRRTIYEGKGGGRRRSVSTVGPGSVLGGVVNGTDIDQSRTVAIQGKDLDVSLPSSPMVTAGLVAVGEEEREIKRLVDSGKLLPCGFSSPPLGLAFYQPIDSTNNGCCPLRVKKVVPGGAAEQRGVRRGDILIGIQGRPLLQPGLAEALADAQTFPATLFFHRALPKVVKPVEETICLSFPRPPLGIAFYEFEEEKEDDKGLSVKKATVGGQAHALGVSKGDVLVGINDYPHLRPDGFAAVLSASGNYPLTCHFHTPGARPVTFQAPPLGLAFYEETAAEGLRVKKAVTGGQAEVHGISKGDVLVGIEEFPHLVFEEFAAVLSSADYYPLTLLFKGTGSRPVTFQAPPLGIGFYHFEPSRKRWEEQELKVKKALAGTLAHQLGVCRGDVLVGIRSLPQVKGGPGLVAALRDTQKFPLVLIFRRRRAAPKASSSGMTLPTPRLFAELGLAMAPPSPPSLSRSPSPVVAASSAGDDAVKALSAAAAAADYASTLAAERLEKLTLALRAEVVALNEARKHAAAEEDRSRRQRGAEIAKLDQQTAAVMRVADEAQGAQQRASQQTSLLESRIKELEEQLAGQASQHLQKVGMAADLAEGRILAAAEHRLKSASVALERELNEASGLRHREAVALRALQDVREREEEERRGRVAAEENAARLELLATGELVARIFPMNDLGMSLSAMLPKKWPLQVRDVDPGGIAEQLGVQRGDILVGIQGRPLLQLGLLDALADAESYPATLLFRRDEGAARRLALLLHLERRMERRAEEKEAMEREKLLRAEEVLRLEQRALELARARNEIVMRSRSRRKVERADMWKEDPRNVELRSDLAERWRSLGELREMGAEDGLVRAKAETKRQGEVEKMEAEDALSFKAREVRKTRWRLRGERELQRRILLWEGGRGVDEGLRSSSATGLEGTAFALAASFSLSSLAERMRRRGLAREARACLGRARDIVLVALPNPVEEHEERKKAKREIDDPIMPCLFDCPPFGFDFCERELGGEGGGVAVVVTRVQRGGQAARWSLPVGSVVVGVSSGDGEGDGDKVEVRSLQHFASLVLSSAFPLVLVFRRPDFLLEEGGEVEGEDKDEEEDEEEEMGEQQSQLPESQDVDLDSVRAVLDAWTNQVRGERHQQQEEEEESRKCPPDTSENSARPNIGSPPLDKYATATTTPRAAKAKEAAELRLGIRGSRVPSALSLQLALEGWAEICQQRGLWAARADALERLLALVSISEKDEHEGEDVRDERDEVRRVTPSRPIEPLSTAASLSPKRRKKKDREDGNSQKNAFR